MEADDLLWGAHASSVQCFGIPAETRGIARRNISPRCPRGARKLLVFAWWLVADAPEVRPYLTFLQVLSDNQLLIRNSSADCSPIRCEIFRNAAEPTDYANGSG